MTEPQCALDGCTDPQRSLGLCHRHYTRWYAIGDPLWDGDDCTVCGRRRARTTDGELRRCRFCSEVQRPRCAFAGCEEPGRWNSLCNGHAQQERKRAGTGRPLEPLRPRRRTTKVVAVRDEHDRKRCSMCERWKPEAEFAPQRLVSDGLDPRCRTCVNRRNTELKYNIERGEYERLLALQDGRCAICHRRAEDRPLFVDHDHSCCPHKPKGACGRCVRGLLCSTCNSGLGMLREDPHIIDRAIAYLSRRRGRS
ncbi:hypothetical protein ONO86_02824 [Micromonospora noduli]|nr:hypothetical protein ONO86_02824 [Micromonospora noduli]